MRRSYPWKLHRPQRNASLAGATFDIALPVATGFDLAVGDGMDEIISTDPDVNLIVADPNTNVISLHGSATIDRDSSSTAHEADNTFATVGTDEPVFVGLRQLTATTYSNLSAGGLVLHPIVPETTRDGLTVPAHLLTCKELATSESLVSDGEGDQYRHYGGRAYKITVSGTAAGSHPSEAGTSEEDDTFSHGTATLQDVGAYQEYCGLVVTEGFTQMMPKSAALENTATYWDGNAAFASVVSATSLLEGENAFTHTGDGSTNLPTRRQEFGTGDAAQNLLLQTLVTKSTASTFRISIQNLGNGFIGRAIYNWTTDGFTIDNEDLGEILATRVRTLSTSPKTVLIEMIFDQTFTGGTLRVNLNPLNNSGATSAVATWQFVGVIEFDGMGLPLIPTGTTSEAVLADDVHITASFPDQGASRASFQEYMANVPGTQQVLGSNVAASMLEFDGSSDIEFNTGSGSASVGDGSGRTGDDVVASYWNLGESEMQAALLGTAGTKGTFSGWSGSPTTIFGGSRNASQGFINGIIRTAMFWHNVPTSETAAILSRYD